MIDIFEINTIVIDECPLTGVQSVQRPIERLHDRMQQPNDSPLVVFA